MFPVVGKKITLRNFFDFSYSSGDMIDKVNDMPTQFFATCTQLCANIHRSIRLDL
jgi:hypothetical protein